MMKENKIVVEKKETIVTKVGKWTSKNFALVSGLMLLLLMSTEIVHATSADAEAMWNATMNLISTWVIRLGLVVVLVGGIIFGLGFKNDDAEAKTRGVNTMIAGGIVTAVAGLVTYLII